jgi:hypothetical protein
MKKLFLAATMLLALCACKGGEPPATTNTSPHASSPGNAAPTRAEGIAGIERVSFIPTPHGWPVQVLAHGNQVLLSNAETYRGLQNIDWRDASAPRLAQSFDTGNTSSAMVMLGHRVYQLANYYGVTMFDISDDGKLTRLGRWRLPPPVDHGRQMVGLQRDGHQYLYLYIKPEGSWKDWPAQPSSPAPGLYLLDVSDVQNVQLQYLGQRPMFTEIHDGYAYIIQGKQLEIYGLDQPASPHRIGGYQAEGNIVSLSIDDSHAWLTVDGNSLELVNIADPSNPTLLARCSEGDMRQGAYLAARGEWAYVLESVRGNGGLDGGLHVFRWHDGQLHHIKHLSWPHSGMQRILLDGNAAYVTDSNYGVWRFDISQPDNPQRGALFMSAGENQQLLIDGNLALLNLEWGGTVGILDVSDPRHIRIQAYYRPGRFDDYAVAVTGGYFYFGKGSKRSIIDVHDPAHPVERGEWELPGQPLIPPLKWKQFFFEWLDVGKNQIRLVAYNMSDPLHPREAGSLTLPEELTARYGAAASDGRRMFAVADNDIVGVDVSDPGAMRLIGSYHEQGIGQMALYSWQGAGRRAALNGDFLYVIQGSEQMDKPRIAVIDVSQPLHMRTAYITPETPPTFQEDWFDERLLHQGDMLNDMVLHGDKLYVSDYWGGVRVYDCRIPSRPQLTYWEFQPYLSLLPAGWSRERYGKAVASGHLHKALGLDDTTWEKRHAIGRSLSDLPLVYHPGYELFGWNIGDFVDDYLLQPKLGGIAVYHIPSDKHLP